MINRLSAFLLSHPRGAVQPNCAQFIALFLVCCVPACPRSAGRHEREKQLGDLIAKTKAQTDALIQTKDATARLSQKPRTPKEG